MPMRSNQNEVTRQALVTQNAVASGFQQIVHRESVFRNDKLKHLHKELQYKSRIHNLEHPKEDNVRQSRNSPDSCWAFSSPIGRLAPAPCYSGKALLRTPVDVNGNVPRPAGVNTGTRLAVSLPVESNCVPHPARANDLSVNKPLPRLLDAERGSEGAAANRALFASASAPQLQTPPPRTLCGSELRAASTARGSLVQSSTSPPTPHSQPLVKDPATSRMSISQSRLSISQHALEGTGRSRRSSKGYAASLDESQQRTPVASSPLPEDVVERDLLLEFDQLNAETASSSRARPDDVPEVIERIGSMMQRLGPRYKTCDKDMLRDRAQFGDIGVVKKRIMRAKSLGLIAVNPMDEVEVDPNIAIEAIGPDVDGDARISWLKGRRQRLNPPLAFLQQLGMTEQEAIASLKRSAALIPRGA